MHFCQSPHSRWYIILGLLLLFTGQTRSQEADLEELDLWADSTYESLRCNLDPDHKAIDSVLLLYPADTVTIGVEKLLRVMGSYFHNQGRYDISFHYLLGAERSLRNRKDSVPWAMVLGGIGEEYRAFGELDKADSVLTIGLDIALAKNDTLAIAYVSGRLAGTRFEMYRSDTNCLNLYRWSVEYFGYTDQRDEVIAHVNEMARVYCHQGMAERALHIMNRVSLEGISPVTEGRFYLTKCITHFSLNEFEESVASGEHAYEQLLDEGILPHAIEACLFVQRSLDSLGRIEEAYQWTVVMRNHLLTSIKEKRSEDMRIAELERSRILERTENVRLKKVQLSQEAEQLIFRRFLAIAISLLIVLIMTVLLLLQNRRNLRKAKDRMIQVNMEVAEKNQELEKYIDVRDRMISVVSHDLRSPLASLVNMLTILKDPDIDASEIQTVVPMMEAQLKNSIDFADNLIVWVKSQLKGTEVKPVSVDLSELTDEAVELSRPIWENRNMMVNTHIEATDRAMADIEMTRFILRNLLNNAIKFSKEGKQVHIYVENGGERIRWIIQDEGMGMTEEQLTNLFQMGKSNHRGPGRGAGIGLYLSHYFAGIMEGSLTAESESGKGSRFVLELPSHSAT